MIWGLRKVSTEEMIFRLKPELQDGVRQVRMWEEHSWQKEQCKSLEAEVILQVGQHVSLWWNQCLDRMSRDYNVWA